LQPSKSDSGNQKKTIDAISKPEKAPKEAEPQIDEFDRRVESIKEKMDKLAQMRKR